MKVRVLGCNGPFPSAGGACSSYLVSEDDTRILLDSGSGSLSNLMIASAPEKLDAIFLSHLHWDHAGEIPVLDYYLHILSMKNKSAGKIDLYMPAVPSDMHRLLAGLDSFNPIVLDGSTAVKIGEISVCAKRMTHAVESYALKLESREKILVYTGDTGPDESLVNFARGCSLLIADSCFLMEMESAGAPHMSARQCALAALEAGAGRLMLSHLSPFIPADKYQEEAKGIFANSFAAVLMSEEEV
ncbi:MAG: MBL fold metallo-hydrolase [Clostridia bacterium]|nr:MBL fold metallo-hydrolase [Clostridia bacterium]